MLKNKKKITNGERTRQENIHWESDSKLRKKHNQERKSQNVNFETF